MARKKKDIQNGNILDIDPETLMRIMEWNLINDPKRASMLVGRPGIGKTDMCHQLIERLECHGIICHPAVHDQTNYSGLPWMVTGQTNSNSKMKARAEFIPIGFLRDIIDAEEQTIVVFDDFGQALPGTQAAGAQLFLERKLDNVPISPYVSFILCTNRRKDKSGVSGIYEMIKSRMLSGIFTIEPTVEAWKKWAFIDKQPTWMIALMNFKPEFITDWEATSDLVNSPCPRTIAACGDKVKLGLPRDLWFAQFSAIAGQGFATEAINFYEIHESLEHPETIIKNPKKARIDTDPAVQWATCASLAAYSKKENFAAILKYFDRWFEGKEFEDGIPRREFALAYFKDATTRYPELKSTKDYVEWSVQRAEDFI
jgi:hypothetical protein